jgi:predicted nucleotidyltransferase
LPTLANHRTLPLWFDLRDDFHAESDIDILVAFPPTANWGLLDRAQMQEELEAVLSRRVDLISKRAIDRTSNPIRRL